MTGDMTGDMAGKTAAENLCAQEKKFDVQSLSGTYHVRELTVDDVEIQYELFTGNPLYYEYCPPYVTRESILDDMEVHPPQITRDKKYYIGFFEQENLVAVMDLLLGYPDDETAFIGLFVMHIRYQGRGTGSAIVRECAETLRRMQYRRIRLAFAKGNPQSRAFWLKNGFKETGEEKENGGYTAVLMEKRL